MTTDTFKRKWTPYLKRSLSKDNLAEHFFAYILKLSDNSYYAGFTRELRERLVEHQDGKTITTRGKNPHLVYFEIFKTKLEAENRERELKYLIKYNQRELVRIILNFNDLFSLLKES